VEFETSLSGDLKCKYQIGQPFFPATEMLNRSAVSFKKSRPYLSFIFLTFRYAAGAGRAGQGLSQLGAQIQFDFALSAIGTVSRSLRDLTMPCVAALYFLK
jgi:hypothetical protein